PGTRFSKSFFGKYLGEGMSQRTGDMVATPCPRFLPPVQYLINEITSLPGTTLKGESLPGDPHDCQSKTNPDTQEEGFLFDRTAHRSCDHFDHCKHSDPKSDARANRGQRVCGCGHDT